MDSEGTTETAIQGGGAVGGDWPGLRPVVVPREVVRPMEYITCVKLNESRSEFADKEGKNTEFLPKLGEGYLGNLPAEEGGENGQKDNKKFVCAVFVHGMDTKLVS